MTRTSSPRRRCFRRRSILLALCAAASLLSACAWIDAEQRELIYRPTPGTLSDWQAITAHDEFLWLPVEPLAGVSMTVEREPASPGLRAIWVPQADPAAPAVLYLHGTFRNVFQNRPKIAAIHAAGLAVLAVEYRGFGDSTLVLPSEQSINQDAEVAWQEFARRVPEAARRVVFGHSMGGAVAVELAWRHRGSPSTFATLVLESTFTSMSDVARDRYPWAALLEALATQHFGSMEKIGQVDSPTWVLAGTSDHTVPSRHSQRLYAAVKRACALVMFEGGSHSGLHREFGPAYQAVWADIAAQARAGAHRCGSDASGRIVHVKRP